MSLRWKAIWVAVICGLMAWAALPSFFSQEQRDASIWLADDAMNLGLDLKGGVYWLLRVDEDEAIAQELRTLEGVVAEAAEEGRATLDASHVRPDGRLELEGDLEQVSHALGSIEHPRRILREVADAVRVKGHVVVGALKRRGGGQDHVGMPRRLVDVDVDRDHEIERLERTGIRRRRHAEVVNVHDDDAIVRRVSQVDECDLAGRCQDEREVAECRGPIAAQLVPIAHTDVLDEHVVIGELRCQCLYGDLALRERPRCESALVLQAPLLACDAGSQVPDTLGRMCVALRRSL